MVLLKRALSTIVLLLSLSPATAQTDAVLVERVFAERDAEAYGAAVEAYFRALEASPSGRYAEQLALVLPDSLTARPRDGAALVRWWRSHDPIPTTPLHEGVVEHRLRVAQATAAFGADTPTGFDARGDVFVRFGTPTRRRVVDFEADLFISRAIREEPSVRRSDFPQNEAWHYPALGPNVYFLFVRTPDGYREGTTMDLLPRALLAGGVGPEMQSRAELLGRAMRWIYKDLYVFSGDVRSRLVTLDNVVGGDGAAYSGNTGLQVVQEVQRARQQDEQAREERDERLPAAQSRVLAEREAGTEWHAARFLDSDSSATVLVPWSQSAETLIRLAAPVGQAVPEAALLDVTVVRYDSAFRREGARTERFAVPLDGSASGTQMLVVPDVPRSGAIAVQWDQRPGDLNGRALTDEPLRASVGRAGDFHDLLPAGAAVGLSDLLLFDSAVTDEAGGYLDRANGLPATGVTTTVKPGQNLTLYLEAYRPGDEPLPVDFEVAVEQRTAGGIFRRSRAAGAAVVTDRVLTNWRSPRTIDLGAVPTDADELTVRVTVTVEETGEQVTRAVTLPVRD